MAKDKHAVLTVGKDKVSFRVGNATGSEPVKAHDGDQKKTIDAVKKLVNKHGATSIEIIKESKPVNVHKMIQEVMEGKDPRTVVEAVDEHMVEELQLYIENDYQLTRSQMEPIRTNLANKMANGVYDHKQAPKMWKYLADAGAKKYTKEMPGTTFDVPTRKAVAQNMADEFLDQAKVGDWDDHLNKKNQKAVGTLVGWKQ